MPPERGLRVLVIAPRAVRVERFAREHAIPVAEAAERLKRLDVLRRDFLSVQFGMESDDPDLYDLVVNSEHLDRKAAARVIVEALRQRFRDQG
jgi:cytidylate kinase